MNAVLSQSHRNGRRDFLRRTVAVGIGLLIVPIAGKVLAKAKKQDVQYQDKPKNGQQCSRCVFFVAKDNSCQVVEGEISPNAWCSLWSPGKGG